MREELTEELCTIPLWFRGRLVAMLRAAFPRSQGETTEFEALPGKSIFRRPALRAVKYVGYFNRMFQHSVDDYERE
jgi:hypothetical protein